MNDNQPLIDDQFLAAMGLGTLTDEQKQQALYNIMYTLNANVAYRVTETLNESQLNEFNSMMDNDPSDEELTAWLKANIPNYQQLIEEEIQNMKSQNQDTVKKAMEA